MANVSKPADRQLPLFAELGVETLPEGAGRLTAKELTFCLEYLRTGIVTEAARLAGYSDPAADGSKIQKRPDVARFLSLAAKSAATDASALVRRTWQRSQALHSDWQTARNQPDGVRNAKVQADLLTQANATDKLLATLLGLDTLKLNLQGNVTFHGLSKEELDHMRELQTGLQEREATGA